MSSNRPADDLVLYLYVDSILKSGIISDNLTSAKSNSELVKSLESLLESALGCPKHPSLTVPLSPPAGPSHSNKPSLDAITVSLTHPAPEYNDCEFIPSYSYYPAAGKSPASPAVVTIPAKEAIQQQLAGEYSETREALDVTAKFFYLPSQASSDGEEKLELDPAWIQESLDHLKIATGLTDVDTFIVSIPGLVFDEEIGGGCVSGVDARTNGQVFTEQELDEQIRRIWAAASKNKHLKSLGVSEFSLARLKWLLRQGAVPDGDESTPKKTFTTGITNTEFRKPRVSQINLRDCCDVPPELLACAKEHNIDLLVHSDCSNLIPRKTFTRLLARHGSRLPPPLISPSSSQLKIEGNGPDNAEELAKKTLASLSAQWVLKYTVFIRDRALVADKGYIVKASRPQ